MKQTAAVAEMFITLGGVKVVARVKVVMCGEGGVEGSDGRPVGSPRDTERSASVLKWSVCTSRRHKVRRREKGARRRCQKGVGGGDVLRVTSACLSCSGSTELGWEAWRPQGSRSRSLAVHRDPPSFSP